MKMSLKNNPVEVLKFQVETPELAKKFLKVDNETWTKYLSEKKGFIEKYVWYTDTTPSDIFTIIVWENEEDWKAIKPEDLALVYQDFESKFSESYKKLAFLNERHYHPLQKINEFVKSELKNIKTKDLTVEYLIFKVEDVEKFIEDDERIWTAFLKEKQGFISKQQWINKDNRSEIHSLVFWENLEDFTSIPVEELIEKATEFGKENSAQLVKRYHELYDNKLVLLNI